MVTLAGRVHAAGMQVITANPSFCRFPTGRLYIEPKLLRAVGRDKSQTEDSKAIASRVLAATKTKVLAQRVVILPWCKTPGVLYAQQ